MYIELTKGQKTQVDKNIYNKYGKEKWYCQKSKNTSYAARRENKTNKFVYLHRLITNCPDSMVVDHINGDGLDNRRVNLRVCTQKENAVNSGIKSSNTSGLRGVSFRKDTQKWCAKIKINYKSISLGCFKSKSEAHKAYVKAIKKHHKGITKIIQVSKKLAGSLDQEIKSQKK